MKILYHEDTGILNVSISHSVPDHSLHYIREVRVFVYGQPAMIRTYSSQPSPDTSTYSYPVIMLSGGIVRVDASCVLVGSITRQAEILRVAATGSQEKLQLPVTQAAGTFMVLPGVLLIILLVRKQS